LAEAISGYFSISVTAGFVSGYSFVTCAFQLRMFPGCCLILNLSYS